MPDILTPERELVDTMISVAAHVEDELEEALSEHRLSRPSFLVLDALERAEGHTLNQRELVSALRRTSGTLSVRLGRLERARMITREPDPENRRSVTVTLTDRGRSLVQRGTAGVRRERARGWRPVCPRARAGSLRADPRRLAGLLRARRAASTSTWAWPWRAPRWPRRCAAPSDLTRSRACWSCA